MGSLTLKPLKVRRLKKRINARVGATVRFRYGGERLTGKVLARLGKRSEGIQLIIEVPGRPIWYSVPRSSCF